MWETCQSSWPQCIPPSPYAQTHTEPAGMGGKVEKIVNDLQKEYGIVYTESFKNCTNHMHIQHN